MLYTDVLFTGDQIYKRRNRETREGLIRQAFGAWQVLSSQVEKLPSWGEYLKKLGLSEEVRLTKEDLKREADEALKKAQNILSRGLNGSR